MPCYACGTPFESDEVHHGDCWLACLHPGAQRHEAKQLLKQWAEKLTAQEEQINALADRLAAMEQENAELQRRNDWQARELRYISEGRV